MRKIITQSDIEKSLLEIGLNEGQTCFLHCDTMLLALMGSDSVENKLKTLVESFQNILGENGTLIVPTFTYSFCEGKSYNPQTSKVNESQFGIFPNYILSRNDFVRTMDPIFSVAIWGKDKAYFQDLNLESSFGEGTIFHKLHLKNAKIVCLGCSLDRVTFVHYVEQLNKVDYRYIKSFNGQIIIDGKPVDKNVDYYVRDLNKDLELNLSKFKKYLEDKGLLHSSAIGRIGIMSVFAEDFFSSGSEFLQQDPYGFVQEQNV
ncbi:MAG: AAC(3) family N-acetyltransferase [Bdellovibrionales bacterium]|nr:AAC(3) family N-acetyltransferase [Bdellovibrionales bacterium]